MLKKLIICLLVLLMGCSAFNPALYAKHPTEFPLDIRVTTEFNQNENIIINKALRSWKQEFPIITYQTQYNWEPKEKFSRFIYKDKPYISVWKKNKLDPSILDLQLHYSLIADGFSLGDFIIIVEDASTYLTKNKFYTIIKHELGHTLGLNHIENKYPALMNSGGNGGVITEYDRIVFCVLYNCS